MIATGLSLNTSGGFSAVHPIYHQITSAGSVNTHYYLLAFSAEKQQQKETVRLEFMHFLPLLGAGKAGVVRQGDHVQFTNQFRVSFTAVLGVRPGEWLYPGFLCDSFCPEGAMLYKVCNLISISFHPYP